jgi:hypothetical protein
MYVGRKYFTKKRGRKRVPSDWQNYWSSCDALVADVKKLGEESFKREIIHLCKTRGQTNYLEAKEQFSRSVLESDIYYNNNILVKFFRKNIK